MHMSSHVTALVSGNNLSSCSSPLSTHHYYMREIQWPLHRQLLASYPGSPSTKSLGMRRLVALSLLWPPLVVSLDAKWGVQNCHIMGHKQTNKQTPITTCHRLAADYIVMMQQQVRFISPYMQWLIVKSWIVNLTPISCSLFHFCPRLPHYV